MQRCHRTLEKDLAIFILGREDRHKKMRRKIYSAVPCPCRSQNINSSSSSNSSSGKRHQRFPIITAAPGSCCCCFGGGGDFDCDCDYDAASSTADQKLSTSLSRRVPRPRRHKNAILSTISIRHLPLEARLLTLLVVVVLLLHSPSAVVMIVPVEGVRASGRSSSSSSSSSGSGSDRLANTGERAQGLWQHRPRDSDARKGSSISRNERWEGGEREGGEQRADAGTRGVAEADSSRLGGRGGGRRRGYRLRRSRKRERDGDGGRRSDSMRRIFELAKADAKAVRAAAQDASAASADAEAAWAASGAGRGGCDGDNATMLFLECEINGRRLRAFVDTGAQVTVMSRACAEYCGLASRIDKRFMGHAIGVGFARILGQIHHAVIRIGNADLTCSLTVIEDSGEIDLLVGLDILRAHRCDISLSRNRMRFIAAGGWREVVDGSAPSNPRRQHYQDNDDVREYPQTPHPRVLRELARGTRGDGIPLE